MRNTSVNAATSQLMTTGILDALTQLFALFASGRTEKEEFIGRQAASRYLRERLPKKVVDYYLTRYDEHLKVFQLKKNADKLSEAKRLAMLSTKVLRTCTSINKELAHRDKCIVYLRLLEFVKSTHGHPSSVEYLDVVCASFLLNKNDIDGIHALVATEGPLIESIEGSFVISSEDQTNSLEGSLVGYRLANETLFLVKYFGAPSVYLNSQKVPRGSVAIMVPGSVLKEAKTTRVFFSDLVRRFLDTPDQPKISFSAQDVSHYFKFPKEQALHQFNISEREGNLVGIMGGSGSGKSTLLNVLNGTIKPSFGKVLINGVDIHKDSRLIQGTIGHIAQEDALIAELSVRENLRYSAKLTFGKLSDEEIEEKVDTTLSSLGLWEIKDLRVGSILDKTVSGGQRKRLNIALELIREPMVLFVDEPTSGLSSHDSIQIMDLLKEMSHRGKLVFAVIHQPSSDLFKLFDKFFILDQGGYPIYYGDPTSTIPYFKELTNQVDPDHAACIQCGNISPEQIFEIIESRVVDEYGNLSDTRRIEPKEWNDFYNVIIGKADEAEVNGLPPLSAPNSTPSAFSQFKTYFFRDFSSKCTNKQYLLVNLLEAPMLAALLALFMKFTPDGGEYIYRTSENIPQFLFISVIVALFLGLSVSAEEIHKDRALLRRERFLFLRWGSYLKAKTAVSFIASAIQTIGFVAVSHYILEIPGFFWIHVIVLFSVSTFGNLLGLNISAAFKSAKVIYMIIPLLIIPQIIFGGAIVRFDRFNTWFTHNTQVPFLGDIMVSRWGFEALAVHSYRENAYEVQFSDLDDIIRHSAWRRDFWLEAICKSKKDLKWIDREWERASNDLMVWGVTPPEKGVENRSLWNEAFRAAYHKAFRDKDTRKMGLIAKKELDSLRDTNYNEEIAEWVLQEDRTVRILELVEGLKPTASPIHHHTRYVNGFNAPYFSPTKGIAGLQIRTLYFNVFVLWLMTAIAWAFLRWMPFGKDRSFKVSR
ncbi:MAG TPA: ATP-binding cassette domain-containing protein [Flavobacteriales bacterium]|nr:ATP-binding cassette domain-containing protein [Flavobacteriales bacterium]HIB78340.1 ATP-binding cassette domain-containing protein [Flavobacteriales bacterium]HIO16181.1 ATP-binding cassette domain-containing protein [Flavobacteriales bacterium]